jgi:hypothetical protein
VSISEIVIRANPIKISNSTLKYISQGIISTQLSQWLDSQDPRLDLHQSKCPSPVAYPYDGILPSKKKE